jgi:hypothetical protein
MWVRGIAGVLASLVGLVWIGQGAGVIKGSGMSGHSQYAVLGVIVLIIGLALIFWAYRVSRRPPIPR